MTNKPSEDELSQELSETVERLKDNDEFRKDYAAMNLHDRDIRKAAKEEGRTENAIENALNFLKMKVLTPDQIAIGTGLPLEKVLELQKSLQ